MLHSSTTTKDLHLILDTAGSPLEQREEVVRNIRIAECKLHVCPQIEKPQFASRGPRAIQFVIYQGSSSFFHVGNLVNALDQLGTSLPAGRGREISKSLKDKNIQLFNDAFQNERGIYIRLLRKVAQDEPEEVSEQRLKAIVSTIRRESGAVPMLSHEFSLPDEQEYEASLIGWHDPYVADYYVAALPVETSIYRTAVDTLSVSPAEAAAYFCAFRSYPNTGYIGCYNPDFYEAGIAIGEDTLPFADDAHRQQVTDVVTKIHLSKAKARPSDRMCRYIVPFVQSDMPPYLPHEVKPLDFLGGLGHQDKVLEAINTAATAYSPNVAHEISFETAWHGPGMVVRAIRTYRNDPNHAEEDDWLNHSFKAILVEHVKREARSPITIYGNYNEVDFHFSARVASSEPVTHPLLTSVTVPAEVYEHAEDANLNMQRIVHLYGNPLNKEMPFYGFNGFDRLKRIE